MTDFDFEKVLEIPFAENTLTEKRQELKVANVLNSLMSNACAQKDFYSQEWFPENRPGCSFTGVDFNGKETDIYCL